MILVINYGICRSKQILKGSVKMNGQRSAAVISYLHIIHASKGMGTSDLIKPFHAPKSLKI